MFLKSLFLKFFSLKYLVLFLTTAAWAAVCFFKVSSSADPSGGDGYFYLKQTEWLAQHFRFYHADYSLIFFPLAGLYKITGSSLLAFQLVTSISLFSMSFALGLITALHADWMKSKFLTAIVGCAFALLCAMQSSLLKLSYEFAKNGFAQAFLLLGLYCYFAQRRRWALGFFVLASLTHKLAFLLVSFLAITFLMNAFRNKRIPRRMIFVVGGGALILLAVLLAFLFSRLIPHLDSFRKNFSFERRLFFQIENQLMSHSLMALTFCWLVIGMIRFKKLNDLIYLPLLIFSLVPFFPVFSGYNTEIKYRLFLLSFTFSAVVFFRALQTIDSLKIKSTALIVSFAVLIFEATQYNGFPWIMNWSEKIQNLDQLQLRVGPSAEVVTQHGLQFYIDYKTLIRARSMVATTRKPQYQIAYTPAFYRLNDELSDEIRQIELLSLGESYGVFLYDDFQELITRYPMLSDWRNQFQVRPDFVQDY